MADRTHRDIFAEARAELKPGRAFRWKGPGVLHVLQNDGATLKVIPPDGPETNRACIVRDPENLKALGKDRIDEMVKHGQAEYVNLVDGAMDLLKPAPAADPGMGEMADAQQAEKIAQTAVTESNARFDEAKALKDDGDPRANTGERLPTSMPATRAKRKTAAAAGPK